VVSVTIKALSDNRGDSDAPVSDCGVLGNEESVLAELGKEGTMGSVMSTDSYVTRRGKVGDVGEAPGVLRRT